METKKCIYCNKVKNVREFYIDMKSLDLYRYNCKECYIKAAKDKAKKVKVKKCFTCNKTKPSDKFYKNCCSKDGLTTKCIKCHKIYQKEYMSQKRPKARVAAYHRWYRKVQRDGIEKHPRELNKRKEIPLEFLQLYNQYRKLYEEVKRVSKLNVNN